MTVLVDAEGKMCSSLSLGDCPSSDAYPVSKSIIRSLGLQSVGAACIVSNAEKETGIFCLLCQNGKLSDDEGCIYSTYQS